MFILKKTKTNPLGAGQIKYLLLITIGLFCITGLFFVIKSELQPSPASADWPAGWGYRKQLRFYNGYQEEDLINFPVYIHLTADNFDFSRTRSDGNDIKFLDADNSTVLSYEIEKWDYAGQEAELWVKVPQIDGGSNYDYIWLYYGNPDATEPGHNAADVWYGNFSQAVWHFNEGIGSWLYDSTYNLNRGELNQNDHWTTSGKINGAYSFDGIDDFAEVADDDSLDMAAEITLEAWLNPFGDGGTTGEIIGTMGNYEFYDQTSNLNPDIIHIADNVYAIVYMSHDGDGWLKTVTINYDGTIGGIIASLEYDDEWGDYPDIIHIAGNVYAIAYNSGGKGYLKTVTINGNGDIGTLKGPLVWSGTAWNYDPEIIPVAGTIYVIVSRGPDLNNCQLKTVQIFDNGDIGSVKDDLPLGADCNNPSIAQIDTNTYVVAYEGINDDGWLKTFNIDASGGISYLNQLEFDAFDGDDPRIVKVVNSSNIYAVAYMGYDQDGFLKTVQINSDGSFGGIKGTLEWDPVLGVQPDITWVANNTYVIAYTGLGNKGWMKTININTAGTSITLVDNFEWDEVAGKKARIIQGNSSNIYPIVYQDDFLHGMLKTVEINTTKGIFKDGAYGIGSDNSNVYANINDQITSAPLNSGWNYVVLTYNQNLGSNQMKLYIDGEPITTVDYSQAINTNSNWFFIGKLFEGMIDEVRVSSYAHSADWVKAQYMSMTETLINDDFVTIAGSFVGFGEELEQYGDEWAWSENFGWFSLECDEDICPGKSYGVYVPDDILVEGEGGEGDVTGEAWSEHIGWVCFGITCLEPGWGGYISAPMGQEIKATYKKYETSSEISGWANIKALGEAGWLKLRADDTVEYPGGPFPVCYDCIISGEGEYFCRSCYKYKHPTYKYGYGPICSNCTDCQGEETGSCTECQGDCYEYGLAYRREAEEITGWAWNANWTWGGSDWIDDNGQPGIGWLQFDTDYLAAINPWLQTKHGDVYSGGSISGPIDTPPGDKKNATFLVHAGDVIYTSTFKTLCEEQYKDDLEIQEKCMEEFFWPALTFPSVTTDYFGTLGRIDLDGIEQGYYGEVVRCDPGDSFLECIGQPGPIITLDGKIYIFAEDQTINSNIVINNGSSTKGNGLILIKGNLDFKYNVDYGSGQIDKLNKLASVGWIVIDNPETTGEIEGNIVIGSDVTNLVGVFYAETNIDTCEQIGGSVTGCDINQLYVSGSMISYGFDFDRSIILDEEGSELIINDGRALVNTPPGMGDLVKGLPIWQQTAP